MPKRPAPKPSPLPGFSDTTQARFESPAPDAPKRVRLPPYVPPKPTPTVRAKIGPAGRLVIPAAFRAAAGMEEGADVTITLHGEEVRIITPQASLRLIQQWAREYDKGSGSAVDELIAERREEARREEEENGR